MKTIAEVLAENPECKLFVDDRGRDWFINDREEFYNQTSAWCINKDACKYFVLPGLRPKPMPREVVVEGFVLHESNEFRSWKYSEDCVPAKLTYTITESEFKKPREFWLVKRPLEINYTAWNFQPTNYYKDGSEIIHVREVLND